MPSSSPAAKTYNKQIQDRAAAVTIQGSPSSKKKRQEVMEISDDEDHNDEPVLPTPAGTANEDLIEDSDSEPVRTASRRPDRSSPTQTDRRSTRKARPKQKQLDFSNARDSDTFDSPVRLTSSRPISSGKGVFASAGQGRMVELSSDSGSDSDLPSARKIMARGKKEVKQKKQRPVRASQRLAALSDSDREGIVVARKPAAKIVSDEEDSGEDMPTTEGKLPRSRRRTRRRSLDNFVVDSPPTAAESEDDVVEVTRSRRKRRREDSEEENEDEDAEEDTHKTPSRRLVKRPRQLSQREKDDLAEDLADLGSSSEAPSSPQPPRSTQSAEKRARLAALAKLKKKRGQPLEQVAEEQEDNDDDGEAGSDIEQVDDEDSEVEEVAAPMSSHQMFRPDENDEDFLVEEGEDDPLGIPEGIPLEFTRYASMRGKELFKFAILWMVQKKINPGFDMNAEIFSLTFRKLDDEVRGLAGSKFTSSVWRPEFTIALEARPVIAYHRPGGALRDKCDACNRSSHPATYEIQFQKKPYHRDTLEDVDNNDDDDEDDDDEEDSESENAADTPDYDSQGRKVVPENTVFYVGKFCTANAKTCKFSHSRHLIHFTLTLYSSCPESLEVSIVRIRSHMAKLHWVSEARQDRATRQVIHEEEGETGA